MSKKVYQQKPVESSVHVDFDLEECAVSDSKFNNDYWKQNAPNWVNEQRRSSNQSKGLFGTKAWLKGLLCFDVHGKKISNQGDIKVFKAPPEYQVLVGAHIEVKTCFVTYKENVLSIVSNGWVNQIRNDKSTFVALTFVQTNGINFYLISRENLQMLSTYKNGHTGEGSSGLKQITCNCNTSNEFGIQEMLEELSLIKFHKAW
jgi:hypothetical protein